ncbi:Rho1 guanine nucleotide exchange factor 1 [Serendipita indica DSM 11827]|nr:Rho1 guanine nucleotide exchange factor 1 [Serendipita indica DSM 11827]
MDHRRTQSAQARVHPPPAQLPPGAQQPQIRPYGIAAGLLNANSAFLQPPNAGRGGAPYRERTYSTSSADLYADSPSSSSYSDTTPNAGGNPGHFPFPEPGLYRSTSAGAVPAGGYNPGSIRRAQRQDTITPDSPGLYDGAFSDESFDRNEYAQSVTSFGSPERSPSLRAEAFTQLGLDQDAIKKFQEGKLNPNDEEWHRLVDPEARNALPNKEVSRQNVLFEVIKSEKDYVQDLEIMRDATPPIIQNDRLHNFVSEVFWNFEPILEHHQRLLGALYERQREQHPIIQSLSDLIMEAVLQFTEDYESYIKHYPLAEARHRREMRRNPAYQEFLAERTADKRTRKRDLITFISRSVTRLPRLKLLLETVLKHTPEDHPDAENLPVLLGIIGDFLKSTQVGIAVAESRVKFVSFCENLTFKRGELIDMDLYGENRTLIHMGPVARKNKNDYSWADLTAVLLDHYFILTREEARGEITKYYVVSRPIPLDFLRLGPFIGPPESRRDANSENAAFLNLNIFADARSFYPFVIADAASEERRYVLYTPSDRERAKWKQVLEETISLRRAYVDANKLFAFEVISDDYMRERTVLVPSSRKRGLTGPMISVTTFNINDRAFIAVAAQNGVYVAFRSDPSVFTLVLELSKITMITALPKYDRLFILCNSTVISYSLRVFADVAQNKVEPTALDKTLVKLTPKAAGHVSFFRVGRLAGRDMMVYDERGLRSSTIHTVEIRIGGLTEIKKGAYLPGIATDVQFLTKHLAIVSDRGMTVLDPFDISNVLTVPDFSAAHNDTAMMALKDKCDSSRTLGMVPALNGEQLCIYEEYGCYIHKHGYPIRKCGFVKWEIKATSYVFRAPYVLLFGENFVEIRHAPTGQFRQMLEHKGLRLLAQTSLEGDVGDFMMSWKGEKNDEFGQSYALVEVVETRDLRSLSNDAASLERSISAISAQPLANVLWEEWN